MNQKNKKQSPEEREKELKRLRQDLEEELLEQFEASALQKKATSVVTSEELLVGETVDEATAKRILEALLFASSKPLTLEEIRKVLKGKKPSEIERFIEELSAEYERENRSFRVKKIAGGWELSTDGKYAAWISKLELQKKARQATQSALETLAIVAYKQPLSRVDIEDLRGVDCSAVLTTLLERGLIKIVGRKEIPGRPFLYGTTDKFLEHFGLAGLTQLPNIEEIKTLVEGSVRRDTLLKHEQWVENPEVGGAADQNAGIEGKEEPSPLIEEKNTEEPVEERPQSNA